MIWPNLADLQLPVSILTEYSLERLLRQDVPAVTVALAAWYPDISIGAESRHLSEAFYYEETWVDPCDELRRILPVVAKYKMDIVALLTIQSDPAARTVHSPMGAVAPDHRHVGLAQLGPGILEAVGRAIGAELAYYFTTLKTRHQQIIAERLGYRLVGIVPAFDRDMVAPECEKRVYEALYAKVLVPNEKILVPSKECLTENTQRLMRLLFPEHYAG
jgi:hypothetical protein